MSAASVSAACSHEHRYLLDTGIISLGDCAVVSTDTDFAAVPRLSVENWTV